MPPVTRSRRGVSWCAVQREYPKHCYRSWPNAVEAALLFTPAVLLMWGGAVTALWLMWLVGVEATFRLWQVQWIQRNVSAGFFGAGLQ